MLVHTIVQDALVLWVWQVDAGVGNAVSVTVTELSVDIPCAFKFHQRSRKHLARQKRPAYSVRGTLDSVEQRPTLNEATWNAGTLNERTLIEPLLTQRTITKRTLTKRTITKRTITKRTITKRTLTKRHRVLSTLQTTTAKALGNNRRFETTRSRWFVYSA